MPDHHRDREPAGAPGGARAGARLRGSRRSAPAAGALGERALSPLLSARRPSLLLGVLCALAAVAAETAIVYPLKHVAPVVSLGVVYLPAVVFVSMVWGMWLGVATAALSVAAFNFFHLPPVGRLEIANGRNWVGLLAFGAVAVATGLLAEVARGRAREAEERRREADLARDMAQLLLGSSDLESVLPAAAAQLAAALGVGQAEIALGPPEERPAGQLSLALEGPEGAIGTLLLPERLPPREVARVRERVLAPLESVLDAAIKRHQLQAEVVETAALRRSDELKTALLRSVSHDLRTPVTAIITAAGALDPDHAGPEAIAEVRDLIAGAATRLSLLIEKLLDLSLLQSGQLPPSAGWCSLEEVLGEAVEQVREQGSGFRLSLDPDLPLLRCDAAQLERAFVNVLENSGRYCAGRPVSVRARMVGGRLRVRIVDEGPGIHPAEQERIFLPFYRSVNAGREHQGSGLGLAIARGFIQANGGRIHVESAPGQGSSFVVEFPSDHLGAEQEPARSAPAAASPGGQQRAL